MNQSISKTPVDEEQRTGFISRYRWWLFGALALVLASWLVSRARAPQPVTIAEVRQGAAERVLAISGRTRPQTTVTIVPKVRGQIVKLTKQEGESVRAGELLVQIDADASRAAVDRVDSDIAAQRRALGEAQRNYERAAQLRERGLATVKDFDNAKFDLDRARQDLTRVAASQREAVAKLSDATIRAPVSGVVLSRPVDTGQVVSEQTIIYEIAPLADVEIEADVDEQFLGELRTGLRADVLLAGTRGALPATLYYISPKVDVRTGGAKVRLRLDAAPPGLRSGLTADVNLVIERRDQAVTVARSAILGRASSARVLLVQNGVVNEQKISFLEWPNERVIVTAGLKPGAQLLAQPRAELIGKRVRAVSNANQLPKNAIRGSEARRAL